MIVFRKRTYLLWPIGQFASNEEVGISSTTVSKSDGTHGNSLDYEGTNYGYKLVDKNTGEILKYGESINPDTRYTKAYLDSINANLEVITSGSKLQIHNWQHEMILDYLDEYGVRPPLNLKDWIGEDGRVITNSSGDKVFISADGTRRVRFDINNPYPHSNPHSHVEELINGQWVKSGKLYPTDVPHE